MPAPKNDDEGTFEKGFVALRECFLEQARQLSEAKELLAKQRELWLMIKDQLDAYDDGIPRVRFTDFHRPIERINFFLGMNRERD